VSVPSRASAQGHYNRRERSPAPALKDRVMQDFEKLGVFYLGRVFDPQHGKATDELLLYDSKDLVTHAVCVGMTGSGKTGLCLTVLEEAAIDAIPSIVIDPKGDLSNLLLTVPGLRAEDFAPWVNEDDARRKGVEPAAYAAQQAELWKKGLASWGQDGERIRRLRDAADFAIYTPGSTAGLPVSIVRSFAAPPRELVDDTELLQERINTTVTGLLGLLGVDADPVQSREHILLSTLLASAWSAGRDLDLAALIRDIQSPPVEQIGVLDLETFFPSKDRSALALRLNNLLAAPGFQAWTRGDPLEIGGMLHTAAGKPRVAIFSISHLGDAERMFFVSLLLNQVLGWMRTQSGTTSLRALLYMDEIFGFFPPVANPPSKAPLLTLLKQARAYGLGVMLATQNPVDLDYKGLGNAGTWFIGRLQTERDKARVLDGLEGAASGGGVAGFDRRRTEQLIAGLGNRVFLMNNVHEDGPVLFETRWAMSYLRGPLTRGQIKALMDPARPAAESTPAAASAGGVASAAAPQPPAGTLPPRAAPGALRPVLPKEASERFIPLRSRAPQGATLEYRPFLIGFARVYFRDARLGADESQDVSLMVAPAADGAGPDWDRAEEAGRAEADLERIPADGATFAPLPSGATGGRNYDAWRRSLADSLYRTRSLELMRSPSQGLTSRPGESERDFRVRLKQASREWRDAAVEKLRQKYAARLNALAERARRAEQAVAREASQARQSTLQTAISVGTTVLGAIFGRKTISAGTIGRATTAARGAGRVYKESQDVGRAEETVAAVRQQREELEAELRAETAELEARLDPATEELETVGIRPKKSDIDVRGVALAWEPYWQLPDGTSQPAS
jgi:hypothetical protein